jgi:hypothetical protein
MICYITHSPDGVITGLYTDLDGYPPLPPDAVAISAADAAILIGGFNNYKLDDGMIVINTDAMLAAARAVQALEIEHARDAACYASVTVFDRIWQADARSQELLGLSITLAQAGLPLPAVWRDAENSDMPITALPDLLAIAGMMAAQTQAAYEKSWGLKEQVAAATTVEDIAAVTW